MPRSCILDLISNFVVCYSAGATSIDVGVEGGALDSVSCYDNGSGVSDIDARLMTRQGHTSKIAAFEDLCNIATLGFRGEALNALCEISAGVTVDTKLAGEKVGRKYTFARTGELSGEPAAVPIKGRSGTKISVVRPFCRTPVRRSAFRKKAKEHVNAIKEVVIGYMLSAPAVRYTNQLSPPHRRGGRGSPCCCRAAAGRSVRMRPSCRPKPLTLLALSSGWCSRRAGSLSWRKRRTFRL